MRKMILIVLAIATCAMLVGCGETVNGVSKDANRMGKGLSTFFFRQP